MNLRSSVACTSKPVAGFLSLTGIAVAVAAGKGIGIIDAAVTKRALGVVVGAMIVLMGNFLPKVGLMNSPHADPGERAAAERAAGWILVLSGIVYISLFLFAPLEQARSIASLVGIGAFCAIIVNWVWLASEGRLRRQGIGDEAAPHEPIPEKRKLIIWLFLAFLYVFAAACVVFLFGDKSQAREVGSWVVLGFGIVYAVLYAVIEERHS